MSHKTAATVGHTIGIDSGKNTLHLIGLAGRTFIPQSPEEHKLLLSRLKTYRTLRLWTCLLRRRRCSWFTCLVSGRER